MGRMGQPARKTPPGPASGWSRREGQRYVVHVEPVVSDRVAFAEAVARGLEDHPRWLSCTYLYDQKGSEIYEQITKQP